MKSDWLEAFSVFSETLNFTHAAERLFISQPALHVKISKLSDFIGKPLYQKVGRNLVLTPEGEKLQAYSREQSEYAAYFIDELRTGGSNRPVCLCAGEGVYQYLLGDVISQFLKQKGAQLTIKTGNQDKTVQSVLSGESHLGIATIENIPEKLQIDRFTEVGQVVVMQRSHPLTKKRTVNLSDLSLERLIVPPKDRPHRVMIDRLLMNVGVQWTPSIEVNGWELMLNFVKLGLGISIVNAYCHIPKTLIAKPLKEFPKIQFQLIQRKKPIPHKSVDNLRKLLFQYKDNWKINNHARKIN